MPIELSGKTAFITGAARGIGLAIAEDLAREGVNICGSDLRLPLLQSELQRLTENYKVETLALQVDVGNEAEVTAAVAQAFSHFTTLDILINNAGVRIVNPLTESTLADWDNMHESNLKGQYLCTREVLRQGMLASQEGTIIFVSSGSGKRGEADSSAYCASKWGSIGFAESIAKELKHSRIRVSTITPGMTWTPMAAESEAADSGLEWLDVGAVSKAIMFCIQQDADTIIPELRVYHRAQI